MEVRVHTEDVWDIYDGKGNCKGYFLWHEEELAKKWATENNGTYKKREVWEVFDFNKFNQMIKEVIEDYYKYRDVNNFFRIDQLLLVCRKQGFTEEQVPQLVEMQNIIVMG